MIKCDIEGSEHAVFADSGQRWLQTLDVLAIETHDSIAPGAAEAVAACFDSELFEHTRFGELELYQRRRPLRPVARPPPRELKLISSEPGLFPCLLQDVPPLAWGFFTFDGDSCQIHPNLPGQKPARAIFLPTLAGRQASPPRCTMPAAPPRR